jgi:SpoVK/Ycf46/Vps4 family AAA+-type ATPase
MRRRHRLNKDENVMTLIRQDLGLDQIPEKDESSDDSTNQNDSQSNPTESSDMSSSDQPSASTPSKGRTRKTTATKDAQSKKVSSSTPLPIYQAFENDLEYFQSEMEWIVLRSERILIQKKLGKGFTPTESADLLEGFRNQDNETTRAKEDVLGLADHSWSRQQMKANELKKQENDLKTWYSEAKLLETAAREKIDARLAVHRKSGQKSLALDEISNRFELDQFQRITLLLAAAPSFSKRFEKYFAALVDEAYVSTMTVEVLYVFFELNFSQRIDKRNEFSRKGKLIQENLLIADFPHRFRNTKDILGVELEINQRTFGYLIGRMDLNDEFMEFSSLQEPLADFSSVVIDAEEKQRILAAVDNHQKYLNLRAQWGFDDIITYGKSPMMLFYGPPGTGKTMTAHAIAKHLGSKVLNVDIPTFIAHREADRFLPGIFREAKLQNALVFFDECEILFKDRQSGSLLTTMLLTELERFDGVAVFATNLPETLDEAFLRRVMLRIKFPEPDIQSRAAIWKSLLPKSAPLAPDLDLESLATRFEMTGGYIKNAVLMAVARAIQKNPDQPLITNEILDEAAAGQLVSFATDDMNNSKVRLKDVVLPEKQLKIVSSILASHRHLPTILRRWKAGGASQEGGIVALLYGPPGTGKTMCAEAIAGEINRPLYIVRTSTILSKYVGESEKNLNDMFQKAKAQQAVLFLDEADSLLGARQQNDQRHDRSLVNLLLSLIERHKGIVLLATNHADFLDEALRRRITHQIPFERPDEKLRKTLWQKLLPCADELDADVDVDLLAKQFELSGAEIKVCVLRAATMAAVENAKLSQKMIEEIAGEIEGGKNGKKGIGFGK